MSPILSPSHRLLWPVINSPGAAVVPGKRTPRQPWAGAPGGEGQPPGSRADVTSPRHRFSPSCASLLSSETQDHGHAFASASSCEGGPFVTRC